MGSVIFILLILIAGILYNIIPPYIKRKKTEIPFWNSILCTGLPIITIKSNDIELHMLVDSGSDMNHIDKKVLDKIEARELEGGSNISTLGGTVTAPYYSVELKVRGKKMQETCLAVDFGEALKTTEEELGYEIHGILGMSFLESHKYVLDFYNFVMYQK